jgi:hypothetical protein
MPYQPAPNLRGPGKRLNALLNDERAYVEAQRWKEHHQHDAQD